ncbi:retention module-containing protein [Vreelandella sulfidaeris]|uniref:retention module-containing protein n=1 Tax=Vreelandella sulfidaeris TaxID=115553 RepID=UPI0011BE0A1B|nr:retention module-containing protein [Halomonas sulfidaeris]
MATATIISMSGQAWARDEAGNLRELSIGDVLQEGEVLITSSDGSVELDFADGSGLNLVEGGQQVAVTPEMANESTVATEDSSVLDEDLEALLTALDDEDGDLLEILDATAAGAGVGGGGGGSHDFVRVARISEETGSLSFETSGGLEEGEFIDIGGDPSVAAAEEVEPTPEPGTGLSGTITLSVPQQVTEGQPITVTATVSNAPQDSPLVITLSNGQQITIAVGEVTGSVTFDSRPDDFYVQGDEPQSLTISDATGGGYDTLDTTATDTVTVVDDNDATTITLSGPEQVTEGDSITITASVDNAPVTDLTITLSNGEQITIAAGTTSGEITFTSRDDDEFQQGNTPLAVSITETEGGNYEALNTDSTATVNVVDDSDTVNATLTSSLVDGSNEDGATVSYTITLGTAPTAEETFTFDVNGEQQSITVAAGATSGSTEFTFSDPDVFLDSDTIGAPTNLESSNNSGYEDLNLVNDATAHDVVDTIDTTTLTLNDVTVKEGTGTATISATLNNAAGKEFTISLSNGATITFAEGETEGTSTPFEIQGDDVYKDGESYDISVTDNGDHNFEKLDASDIATVTIKDTIDITDVSINAIVTKTSEINVGNVDNTDSFTVTAYRVDGEKGTISQVTGTNHDGFGVVGTTSGSGASSELGYINDSAGSESIVVAFNNEVKTFDVQFAWRNNREQAKVEFFDKEGNSVGWAIVSGGGTSADALVTYYDAEGTITKTESAPGGSDQVDNSYTFEPGSGETFTRAEFTAVGNDDDYLIHSINYKEVMDGEASSIGGASEVIFEIETSNPPDESQYTFEGNDFPTAKVLIGGEEYIVKLDRNGKGTVA